jgi:hypothetical protein
MAEENSGLFEHRFLPWTLPISRGNRTGMVELAALVAHRGMKKEAASECF